MWLGRPFAGSASTLIVKRRSASSTSSLPSSTSTVFMLASQSVK
jgi:hypothetical protein